MYRRPNIDARIYSGDEAEKLAFTECLREFIAIKTFFTYGHCLMSSNHRLQKVIFRYLYIYAGVLYIDILTLYGVGRAEEFNRLYI